MKDRVMSIAFTTTEDMKNKICRACAEVTQKCYPASEFPSKNFKIL